MATRHEVSNTKYIRTHIWHSHMKYMPVTRSESHQQRDCFGLEVMLIRSSSEYDYVN